MAKTFVILQKVLVNYFYKVNAGLFTFAFFVLFGLPYSVLAFHYSLIIEIVQSQVFLALVLLCWVLYNLKCIDYVVKQLQHPQQSFLFCINSLSIRKIYLLQLFVQAQVYMPAFMYSIVIVVIAFKKHEYLSLIEVMLFDLIMLLATPFVYVLALQQKRQFLPSLKLRVRKPYFLFPLYFLLRDRKQMLLVTKIFSLLLLYAFNQLYEPEKYDLRPVQLCLLIAAAAHCALAYEIRIFGEQHLAFSKNLPITIVGRFLRMIAMYMLLVLPEFILLLKGLHLHFSIKDYPQLLLLVIALLCLFDVVLLLADTNMEQLIRIVFGICAACFFIILYNPGIVLPVSILVLAFLFYNSYYYQYEKQYR